MSTKIDDYEVLQSICSTWWDTSKEYNDLNILFIPTDISN